MANTEISLSGTVKNGDGAAIAGAIVTIASNTSLSDTTNAKGEFSIINSTSISRNEYRTKLHCANSICIRGNQLLFSIAAPVKNGLISIYSSNGKRNLLIPLGNMETGVHKCTLPRLSAGVFVMHITIDKSIIIWKLVNTGNKIFTNENNSRIENGSQIYHKTAAVSVEDTIVVQKDGYKTLRESITSHKQTGISIIMDRTKSGSISVKDLPIIKEMPDPMTMKDGTKVTTVEQWKIRRREMIRILEDYEYGHMPPPPGNVKGTIAMPLSRITVSGKLQADYRMMHLTFGTGEKLGFDLGIFTPVTPPQEKGYPVLISLDFSAGKTSLGAASAALSRGYAVATIPYQQLGADATNYRSTAFFPSYPEYDWRDFSAWAWGISRAVDYLVTDSVIDGEKIIATGTSRNGQAVLIAGAFDERIALSAPVAGGMAFRFSGKEMGGGLGQGITEIVDQNTYWFGPLLPQFKNQTERLPCDQHWLPALTSPRLFIMCNSLADPYGRAYAAVQTYLGAKPVYEFLDAGENLGLNFRSGGHGMTSEDWSALLDFADQNLLKKGGTRKFDVLPPADKLP